MHSQRRLRFSDPATNNDRGWKIAPRQEVLAENLGLGVRLYYAEWLDEQGNPLYRQPMFAERGGTAMIAVDRDAGSFCMVPVDRPLVRDLDAYRQSFPEVDPENLGSNLLEAPRGLSEKVKTLEGWDDTARREFEEETQLQVAEDPQNLRWDTVPNTTFFVQPTKLYLVQVTGAPATTPPDVLDGITGGPIWTGLDAYRELRHSGRCVDSYTDSLLLAVMLQFPGLLK